MKVTILTPTYNRKYTLGRLYNSLVNQTSKNFEWLVIDDGSNDDTKDLIENYIKENKINIKYVYQKNGGKHRALNTGIKLIKNELTFFVDSDDYLEEDAVEVILEYAKKYIDNEKIAVLSFLKAYPNHKINGPKYKKNEFVGDYIHDRLNTRINGDKAEVCFTKKLQEFSMLEIDGEKFLSEYYLWVNIALKYDTVFINKIIYISEYLNDGLTKNYYKIRYNSPIGTIETYRLMYNKKANIIVKSIATIKYTAYCILFKKNIWYQIKHSKNKILFIITYLVSVFYSIYISTKIKH